MELSATAPAKIILIGEHAVVFGEPALAVPVSGLSATVEAKHTETPGLHIVAANTNEQLTYTGEDDENPILHMVHLVLESITTDIPDLALRIESSIPIASGLGSGAAVSTALGRALGLALKKPLAPDHLNQLVYEVERLHHGTPSGIDNTVIVYARPVFYVRDAAIRFLQVGRPFDLLIADTGQQALTRIAVGDVRRLYESQTEIIQPVLAAIGQLARNAAEAIAGGQLVELGLIMNDNHRLLQQLTVSSNALDELVRAARNAGALGAKLSGGGRGGNMIALVTSETRAAVRTALADAGAKNIYETTVS